MNILLVEDEKDLQETIKEFLEFKGFKVFVADSAKDALDIVYRKNVDLVLLDVKLPDEDGFSLANRLKEFSDKPIIFLTSLDEEKDIEKGFLVGADDYITKPFSLNELYLRIKAVLRRVYNDLIVKIDEFEFDLINLELKKNNETIHLKKKEALLLKEFLKNRNKVLTKEYLLNVLYDEEANENSLRTFIRNLRHILGKEKIKTIKDVGYKFV